FVDLVAVLVHRPETAVDGAAYEDGQNQQRDQTSLATSLLRRRMVCFFILRLKQIIESRLLRGGGGGASRGGALAGSTVTFWQRGCCGSRRCAFSTCPSGSGRRRGGIRRRCAMRWRWQVFEQCVGNGMRIV